MFPLSAHLWIDKVAGSSNQIVYVPSDGGLRVLEAGRNRRKSRCHCSPPTAKSFASFGTTRFWVMGVKARAIDWDPIRELHQGQRSWCRANRPDT
jgi:hypothetical protein